MPPEYYATEETLAHIEAITDILTTNLRSENRTWGYMDRLSLQDDHTMTEEAGYNMLFATVPANEIWIVQGISARNSARGLKTIFYADHATGVSLALKQQQPAAGWDWAFWTGKVVLKYLDKIRIEFRDAITNDILYGQLGGYKMKTWI